MTRVVPPRIAAFVPVSKSSAVTVPATSRSKWVCPSINPGKSSFPDTSITSASSADKFSPTLTIFSPSIRTSWLIIPEPDTTVPFFSKYFIICHPRFLFLLFNIPLFFLSFNCFCAGYSKLLEAYTIFFAKKLFIYILLC